MTCQGPAAPIIHRENTDLMNVLLHCQLVHSHSGRGTDRTGFGSQSFRLSLVFVLLSL